MLYESLLQHESDNPLQKCHDKDHDVPMAQQMGVSSMMNHKNLLASSTRALGNYIFGIIFLIGATLRCIQVACENTTHTQRLNRLRNMLYQIQIMETSMLTRKWPLFRRSAWGKRASAAKNQGHQLSWVSSSSFEFFILLLWLRFLWLDVVRWAAAILQATQSFPSLLKNQRRWCRCRNPQSSNQWRQLARSGKQLDSSRDKARDVDGSARCASPVRMLVPCGLLL